MGVLLCVLLLGHLFMAVLGQTTITVSSGTTRVISSMSDCMFVADIMVNGGVLIVRGHCSIMYTLSVSSGGRVEVDAGASLMGMTMKFTGSSSAIVAGSLGATYMYLETGAQVEYLQGSTLYELQSLNLSGQSQLIMHSHTLESSSVHIEDSQLICKYRCVMNVESGTLSYSKFLANAVSMEHQDCGNPSATTIASGGNHAGCSGEHSCCPISTLTPVGNPYYPRNVGFKGGTCADDGAGLGGGSWEIIFAGYPNILGINYVQANGGSPDPNRVDVGGGGSGGSIIVRAPGSALEKFRFEVNGGNALSKTGQPAYGGSAGRISYLSHGDQPLNDVSHLVKAYGGKNAGVNGWGAAGTFYVPHYVYAYYGGTFSPNIHIYEQESYYGQTPVPYYPATFIEVEADKFPQYQGYALRLKTRSDVFFYAPYATTKIYPVIDASDVVPGMGAVVNGSPDTLEIEDRKPEIRREKPLVPSISGICSDWYRQFDPALATASSTATPSTTSTKTLTATSTRTATPSTTSTKTLTATSTRTATPSTTSTKTLTATSTRTATQTPTGTGTGTGTRTATTTNTRTATPTPTTTTTRTATPTGGPCHTTGAIKVTSGWTCNYQVPVTLTTVEVTTGGKLTFSAGLTASKIIATSPGLLEIKNQGISVGELVLNNAQMTVGSGLTIDTGSVQMTGSVVHSLGTLNLVVEASLTMDANSHIKAVGKGLTTPTNGQGGDARTTTGLGGVHAGCTSNECTMRQGHSVKAYGDAFNPTLPGVSGRGTGAGAGGGVITITCGTLNSSGTIDASGANGSGNGGGGAGGSIRISASIVNTASTPVFLARGGNAASVSSHPGSGGRIAVKVTNGAAATMLQSQARYSIRGGTYTNGELGPPGTYYVEAGTNKYLSSRTNGGTLRHFATVFVFCDGSSCPALTEVQTDLNSELLFSTSYVGAGCGTAQVNVQVNIVRVGDGSYVSASPCVTMVANQFMYNGVNNAPQLVANTVANHQYVDTYYNAHFAYESWNAVKSAIVSSNAALQTRLNTIMSQQHQCDSDLTACLASCDFYKMERPTGTIQGGDTVLYRVIATKAEETPITEDDAKKGVRALHAYLAGLLLYPRANIVEESHEIHESSLIVYFSVTVPASGSKAGECLESHLRWNM